VGAGHNDPQQAVGSDQVVATDAVQHQHLHAGTHHTASASGFMPPAFYMATLHTCDAFNDNTTPYTQLVSHQRVAHLVSTHVATAFEDP
jgi:hypothetical protein